LDSSVVDRPELRNPFRPGAGHMPPYLAGRETEKREFSKLLDQDVVLENLVLTGLRGVGKTVLLETLKPIALQKGWLWVGTDLSESTSVSETTLSIRLLTDLAVSTASVATGVAPTKTAGYLPAASAPPGKLDYQALHALWQNTPGLVSDKLKAVLELVWLYLEPQGKRGIVFAYDEAQNLSDHAEKDEYPLSLLLDVFQSLQRKGVRFLLVLTGLPTLFPKLVEARTFAERMFHVLFLDKLDRADTGAAISGAIERSDCPINFNSDSVDLVYEMTVGYPYFIQYVCKEAFDVWVQNFAALEDFRGIPAAEIMRKLDTDFFAGRWARATDRQRDLMGVIAQLKNCAVEFTVQEVAEQSVYLLNKPFSGSHANQMLAALCEAGLVYKNRWGKYSLAVPLLDRFIRRQIVGGEES